MMTETGARAMSDHDLDAGFGDVEIIDTHVHVWRRAAPWMSWLALRPASWDVVRRDFGWAELRRVLDEAGVARLVLVQAATSVAESQELLRLAAAHESVVGVVGWATLVDPRATEVDLDRLGEHGLVGVRSLHGWTPDGDVLAGGAIESCRVLADRGLTLDLFVNSHDELGLLIALAERVPTGLRLIIDHLGRPPIGSDATFAAWAASMRTLSRFPNVYVKYSGWATVVERVRSDDVRPYVLHALEHFGSERVMFASNWPVALVAGDYAETFRATVAAVGELTNTERANVFTRTSERCYLDR